MNTSDKSADNLSFESDEEIELDIINDDDVDSEDYDNPKIEQIKSEESDSLDNYQDHAAQKFGIKSNMISFNQKPNPKDSETSERKQKKEGNQHKGRYSTMLKRLEKEGISFDHDMKDFRFNINYDRKNFFKFIENDKNINKKKIKEFLQNEEHNDKYDTAKSCLQCGIQYFLPSFQLLR
jgi:hypothetical protein